MFIGKNRTSPFTFAARAVSLGMAVGLMFGSSIAFAGKKGGGGSGGGGTTTNPPPPTNFRVTAKTAYSITVAWDVAASTSDFNFHLSGTSQIAQVVLPKTTTSHTFNALAPGNEYWLFIYTRDAAGNSGGQAQVTARTLLDTTPPWTAPVVTVGEVGSTYANLSWTRAQDDGPYHYAYELWLNGSLHYRSNFPRDAISTVLRFLQPNTTYTVQIRTIDYGGHPSPISSPVSFTTPPPNPNDTTPPTTPGNLWGDTDGSSEIWLTWTQSTDDFDAQANIRYDVYVNGVYQDVLFGSGGPSIVFGQPGANLIEVFAIDTAGNTSAAGTTTIFF